MIWSGLKKYCTLTKWSKILLRVPIRDLHSSLIKHQVQGYFTQSIYDDVKVIINNIPLRKYPPPPQTRKMSNHSKLMCDRGTFITELMIKYELN